MSSKVLPSKLDFSREYICVVNGEVSKPQDHLVDLVKIIKKGNVLKAKISNRPKNQVVDWREDASSFSELIYRRICVFDKPVRTGVRLGVGSEGQQIPYYEDKLNLDNSSSSSNNNKGSNRAKNSSSNSDKSSSSSNSSSSSESLSSDVLSSRQTLIAVYPMFGPKHHVRAQLANAGYPIVGDETYGVRYVLMYEYRYEIEASLAWVCCVLYC